MVLPCPTGTGGAFGNCTACAVGFYKNYTANTECTTCPAATYADSDCFRDKLPRQTFLEAEAFPSSEEFGRELRGGWRGKVFD